MLDILTDLRNGKKLVGVVGLGYVGLPLACLFAEKGFGVLGYDVNTDKIGSLKRGCDPTKQVASIPGGMTFTADPTNLRRCALILICVPTPRDGDNINTSIVEAASKSVAENLSSGTIVCYESSVYPGLTEELIRKCFQKIKDPTGKDLKIGIDFHICYSPERINPGDKTNTLGKINKLVSGDSKDSAGALAAVYKEVLDADVHICPSIKVAEMAKIYENIQRASIIALANELAFHCKELGIESKDVLDACATKWNFVDLRPGIVSGDCVVGGTTIRYRAADRAGIISVELLEELKIPDVDVLSLTEDGREVFKPLKQISKRLYTGELCSIKTSAGRSVQVTAKHPMLVCTPTEIKQVLAEDVQVGQVLPLVTCPPENTKNHVMIDLLKELGDSSFSLRLRPKNLSIRELRAELKNYFDPQEVKVICNADHLMLEQYKKVKHLFDHDEPFTLISGSGSSYREVPRFWRVDENFCRLLGYFLSEGCISAGRTYFSFHSEEREEIEDVESILDGLHLTYAEYPSRVNKAMSVKVGSIILSKLLQALGCGYDSYTVAMPDFVFSLSKICKEHLIGAMFSGDGAISLAKGHVDISYFSQSKVLIEQLSYLLSDLGYLTKINKGGRLLRIAPDKSRLFAENILRGKKREKALSLLPTTDCRKLSSFFKTETVYGVAVKSIFKEKVEDLPVFSLEIEETHTFAVNTGIYIHNCLPVNPVYYLSTQKGFDLQVVRAVKNMNDAVPKWIALELIKKCPDLKKVGFFGAAYKENIGDFRHSGAYAIKSQIWDADGDQFIFHDPFVDSALFKQMYGHEVFASLEGIADASLGAAVVCVGHDVYKDAAFLEALNQKLVKGAWIFDLKGILEKQQCLALGFNYWQM